MSDSAPTQRKEREKWRPSAESVSLLVLGFFVFAIGRWVAEGAPAKAIIQVVGASGVVLAPIIARAEGTLVIGLRGIRIDLAERQRAEAVAMAAVAEEPYLDAIIKLSRAPHRALVGILPFLSGHVGTEVVVVPENMTGRKIFEDLTFIRQELQVSVVALRHAGDVEWQAGGAVSTEVLRKGTELLVAGPPESISALRQRLT